MRLNDYIVEGLSCLAGMSLSGAVGFGSGYLIGSFVFHAQPLATGTIYGVALAALAGIQYVSTSLADKNIIRVSTASFIVAGSSLFILASTIASLALLGIIGPMAIGLLSGGAAISVALQLTSAVAKRYTEDHPQPQPQTA